MLNPRRDAGHLGLGAASEGAVDVATCRAAGISDDRLWWLVQSGRWQSPYPRVYVAFSGPMPLLTVQHAALLYAGAGAVLSHQSAGRFWRLCPQPPVIHVTVPYDRQVDDQPGLVLHRSRTLTAADVQPALVPARTRIERTILDLLAGKPSANSALGLVADAMRERSTTPDRLRQALLAHQKTRWRRTVLEALPDLRAGAQSALELHDARMRRRHRLPCGRRQARRATDGVEYLDVLIEEFGLHIELDGRLGSRPCAGDLA
jgi:hypothetical protein